VEGEKHKQKLWLPAVKNECWSLVNGVKYNSSYTFSDHSLRYVRKKCHPEILHITSG